jgi:hypothetical protein
MKASTLTISFSRTGFAGIPVSKLAERRAEWGGALKAAVSYALAMLHTTQVALRLSAAIQDPTACQGNGR